MFFGHPYLESTTVLPDMYSKYMMVYDVVRVKYMLFDSVYRSVHTYVDM